MKTTYQWTMAATLMLALAACGGSSGDGSGAAGTDTPGTLKAESASGTTTPTSGTDEAPANDNGTAAPTPSADGTGSTADDGAASDTDDTTPPDVISAAGVRGDVLIAALTQNDGTEEAPVMLNRQSESRYPGFDDLDDQIAYFHSVTANPASDTGGVGQVSGAILIHTGSFLPRGAGPGNYLLTTMNFGLNPVGDAEADGQPRSVQFSPEMYMAGGAYHAGADLRVTDGASSLDSDQAYRPSQLENWYSGAMPTSISLLLDSFDAENRSFELCFSIIDGQEIPSRILQYLARRVCTQWNIPAGWKAGQALERREITISEGRAREPETIDPDVPYEYQLLYAQMLWSTQPVNPKP